MIHFIYTLTDPRPKVIRYVGKTNNLSVRLALHLCEKRGTHKNNWLHQLRSLGLRPIEECTDETWAERERFWIAHFRSVGIPLTNLDSGGCSGKQQSDETKEKIRSKAIGRKHSAETIAKISAAKSNPSKETLERYSKAQLGKKQSPETIAKRSASLKGHTCSEETRRKIGDANRAIALTKKQSQFTPTLN